MHPPRAFLRQFDPGYFHPKLERDTVLFHALPHNLGHILILPGQYVRRNVENGNLAAESGKGVGHFRPDGPRPDNDETPGQRLQVEGLAVCNIARVLEPGNRKGSGGTTGCDDNRSRRDRSTVDGDLVRREKARPAEQHLGTQLLEAFGGVVLRDFFDHAFHPSVHRFHSHRRPGHPWQTEALELAGLLID